MDDTQDQYDELLRLGAQRLTGHQRRLFQAQVCLTLCDGNPRLAERRFGWGRHTVQKGLHEYRSGVRCLENFQTRGARRSEDKNPQLAADIRAIVEPQTYADPELRSSRRYSNLSAAEVLTTLRATKGYHEGDLPSERAMRDILNRMGYRLKRVQKGKPLKKTKETDAIFANIEAVRQEVRDDPVALEISIDTKAKVAVGDYVRGGKKPDGRRGQGLEGLGPRPAGEGEAGAVRGADVADGCADARVRLRGDK
jgi:Rhodopirellula transposase DDE domain